MGPTSTTTGALPEKEVLRLPEKESPSGKLEDEIVGNPMWRQNHSSIAEHASRVVDVLNDQSSRGQILKLPEAEARLQFHSSRRCVTGGSTQR